MSLELEPEFRNLFVYNYFDIIIHIIIIIT